MVYEYKRTNEKGVVEKIHAPITSFNACHLAMALQYGARVGGLIVVPKTWVDAHGAAHGGVGAHEAQDDDDRQLLHLRGLGFRGQG